MVLEKIEDHLRNQCLVLVLTDLFGNSLFFLYLLPDFLFPGIILLDGFFNEIRILVTESVFVLLGFERNFLRPLELFDILFTRF